MNVSIATPEIYCSMGSPVKCLIRFGNVYYESKAGSIQSCSLNEKLGETINGLPGSDLMTPKRIITGWDITPFQFDHFTYGTQPQPAFMVLGTNAKTKNAKSAARRV